MIALAFVVLLAASDAANPQAEPTPSPAPEVSPSITDPPNAATPWTWSVNEEGVVRSWQDDPKTTSRREDLVDGMNRLFGVVTRGSLEAGLQLDIPFAHPAERAALTQDLTAPPPGATTSLLLHDEDGDELEGALVAEKKFVRWHAGWGNAELGDTYRAVGRGLAIALVRNTELDIDTSLEGASVDVKHAGFEAAAFGGWSNPQTVSAAFANHIRHDARDRILGGRVAWAGPIEPFVHGATYAYDHKLPVQLLFKGALFEPVRATVVGGGFAVPDIGSGFADFYVEGVGMSLAGEDQAGDVEHDGYGAYAAANLYFSAVTVTLEGKSYENLELLNVRQAGGTIQYDYSTPPTLEKENLVNYQSTKAVNSLSVHGGKATVSFPLWKGLLGRTTWLHLEDLGHREDAGAVEIDGNERIEHAYAGIEKRAEGFFFQLTAGTRYETRLADRDVHEMLLHLDGDLLLPLPRNMSIELKGLGYRQTETEASTGFERTNDVTSFVASVRPFRWMSIAGLVDTATDARIISGFGSRPGNLSDQAYGAVEISVEPTEKTVGRLFAGATQGGLKCSGGTCRVVPAFEGVRVEWLARF